MNKNIKKITVIFENFWMFTRSLMWKRDDSIVLIGAWFGNKFADNSRYLFQYLDKNKEELGLTHVVWVTRNKDTYSILKNMNYEVYMMDSKESIYFHKHAGWHIVCNSNDRKQSNGDGFICDGDININYSYRAKCIQLWHGVGMKAVGSASNISKRKSKFRRKCVEVLETILGKFWGKGQWNNCKVLATSSVHAEIMSKVLDIPLKNVFISIYPRHCKCIKYTLNEKKIISYIKEYKKCFIYLPTFRSEYSKYVHPLTDDGLKQYLQQNDIVWIEKPHSVSNFQMENDSKFPNLLYLDPDFDINILLDYVDAVITDYSSVAFDSIKKDIPTILYTPDLDLFANSDVGFLYDYGVYFNDIIAQNIEEFKELIKKLKKEEFFNEKRIELYFKLKKEFFEKDGGDCSIVWADIKKCCKK